jgi:soluble lytic murein transglycosylase
LALRELGEDTAAAERFFSFVSAYPTAAQANAASFYLAESFVRRGQLSSAIAALSPIAERQGDPFQAQAIFLLALSQERSGDLSAAVVSYQRAATMKTPVVAYARFRQAEALVALGRQAEALPLYDLVAHDPQLARGERALAYERAIATAQALQQPAESLRFATDLLAFAQQPAYRAKILLLAAEVAQAGGQGAQATAWLNELIDQHPNSEQAVAALVLLKQVSPIDPRRAALIYSNAERWAEARAAYAAAVANAPADLELRRLAALILREGETPDRAAAVAALDQILAEADPASDLARQVRLDRIQTIGQQGDLPAAIAGYQAYAAEFPDDPRAPEALRRAAILLERQGDSAAALAQRQDLIARFPASQAASDLRFAVAMQLYQNGNLAEASALWQAQAQQQGSVGAQGLYWAARAAAQQGDTATANQLFEQVIALTPEGYYAARAAAMVGRPPQGRIAIDIPFTDQDWAAVEAWVAGWAPSSSAAPSAAATPAATAQSTPEPIADPQVQLTATIARAAALGELTLYAEARSEWLYALEQAASDPQLNLLVARAAATHGRFSPLISAATAIWSSAPAEARSQAPLAIWRLRFPLPYVQALRDAARQHGVDPLALAALMRQESRFDPQIVSAAGARGLAQVMPATGQGIAQRLGVQPYSDDDLFRPGLSLRFGAFYLGVQLRQFEQSLPAALSAYNGGAGNTQRWIAATGLSDSDYFTEQIDFGETRNYVKVVQLNYYIYQTIYHNPG